MEPIQVGEFAAISAPSATVDAAIDHASGHAFAAVFSPPTPAQEMGVQTVRILLSGDASSCWLRADDNLVNTRLQAELDGESLVPLPSGAAEHPMDDVSIDTVSDPASRNMDIPWSTFWAWQEVNYTAAPSDISDILPVSTDNLLSLRDANQVAVEGAFVPQASHGRSTSISEKTTIERSQDFTIIERTAPSGVLLPALNTDTTTASPAVSVAEVTEQTPNAVHSSKKSEEILDNSAATKQMPSPDERHIAHSTSKRIPSEENSTAQAETELVDIPLPQDARTFTRAVSYPQAENAVLAPLPERPISMPPEVAAISFESSASTNASNALVSEQIQILDPSSPALVQSKASATQTAETLLPHSEISSAMDEIAVSKMEAGPATDAPLQLRRETPDAEINPESTHVRELPKTLAPFEAKLAKGTSEGDVRGMPIGAAMAPVELEQIAGTETSFGNADTQFSNKLETETNVAPQTQKTDTPTAALLATATPLAAIAQQGTAFDYIPAKDTSLAHKMDFIESSETPVDANMDGIESFETAPIQLIAYHPMERIFETLAAREARINGIDALQISAAIEHRPIADAPLALSQHSIDTSRADVARSVGHQMAAGIAMQSDRPIELTLSPEELGRVRLSMHSNDHSIIVSVQADRQDTLDLMRKHIESLTREFREMGYSDISFSFSHNPHSEQRAHETEPRPETAISDTPLSASDTPPKMLPIQISLDADSRGLDLLI
jgi:hypothetical protein